MPAAMAPDDTMITSEPAFMRASIASTSPASRPASNMPVRVVSAVVPTLTTTLRAVRTASRAALFIRVAVFAPLPSGRLTLVGADPVGVLQACVGAASRHHGVDAGRCLRLPVERDVADGDRAARACAQPHQFVLDAQASQPVAEIADRFVVLEAGLGDPAFRPPAADHEPALTVGFHAEAGLVDG